MFAQQKHHLTSQTELQKLVQSNQRARSSASKFYSLMRQAHPPKLDGLKRAWEEDQQVGITMEKWKELIRPWCKTSREMQTHPRGSFFAAGEMFAMGYIFLNQIHFSIIFFNFEHTKHKEQKPQMSHTYST